MVAMGYDLVEWAPHELEPGRITHDRSHRQHGSGTRPQLSPSDRGGGEIGESLHALTGRFDEPVAQWDWHRFSPRSRPDRQ